MTHVRQVKALVLAATASTGCIALGEEPIEIRDEALRGELAALQGEIAQLRAEREGAWMTETRAEEIRSLVRDVLADADTRSSLLADAGTTGYDNGFFLETADGRFRLRISGHIQWRYVHSRQKDGPEDDSRGGFELRRNKVGFDGHVFDETWNYKIRGDFDNDTGMYELQSAWVRKELGDDWTVRVGQFKVPFMREESVSSRRQLLVERSLVDRAFNQRYSQGVEVVYEGEQLRVKGAISDGFRTANTPSLAYDTEWAITGRAEVRFGGKWSHFKEFTSWRGRETAFLVGAAVHYQSDEYGTTDDVDKFFRWTVDATLKLDGANVMVALVGDHEDNAADEDGEPWGFVAQGGVFLTDELELIGRYEHGDGDIVAEDLNVATVGFNYYFDQHGMKLTSDLGYAFDPVDDLWASDGAGWRADAPEEDGQVVVRAQLQLLF